MMTSTQTHTFPPGRDEFKLTAAQLHSELAIQTLVADSRRVTPGSTFVAYPGDRQDGRQFIEQALERGAHSILWDPERFVWPSRWQGVLNRAVPNLKDMVSYLAAEIEGHPSKFISVIGITGTNGKSTCSHWLAQLLTRIKGRCGVMGTLGNGLWPNFEESLNTTADAVECQKWLRYFLDQQSDYCVMEVSSHGLVQSRVSGVDFTGAVFTNLTRDHLDYHATMEAYAEAKALLFQANGLRWAVINSDDPCGQMFMSRYGQSIPQVLGFSIKDTNDEQIVVAKDIRLSAQGVRFQLCFAGASWEVYSPVLGGFNVTNLLATLASLHCLGIPFSTSIPYLSELQAPKGRLEKITTVNQPLVVVDYAHTPDALSQALRTLKEILPKQGRLFCIFGCGGERDKGKRPLMGQVACDLAHEVVLTTDNPRSENPNDIIEDILSGMDCQPEIILDRRQAIQNTIRRAQASDIVLVAGKGHEQYQEIDGQKRYFSDQQVIKECIEVMA